MPRTGDNYTDPLISFIIRISHQIRITHKWNLSLSNFRFTTTQLPYAYACSLQVMHDSLFLINTNFNQSLPALVCLSECTHTGGSHDVCTYRICDMETKSENIQNINQLQIIAEAMIT